MMVIKREKERETSPTRHKLPPVLTWGHQRYLRCSKTDPTAAAGEFSGHRKSPEPKLSQKEKRVFVVNKNYPSDVAYEKRVFVENKNGPSDSAYEKRVFVGKKKCSSDVAYEKRVFVENKNCPSDEGIDMVREKVMMDLKAETDRIRAEMLGQERFGNERERVTERPWKLRERVKIDGEGDRRPGFCSVRTDLKSSGKLRGQRPEFSVSLSRSEVEEDFAAMVGHRPHRRPKKRPKAVQKQLDNIFPGLWLPEITPDLYKVDEAETGKK